MRLPSLWGELKEIIGDAMLVAFGCILLFIFLTIEVFGRYGVENNTFIRWVEIFMGLPLIVLGVERFIHDVRRFNAMRRNKNL